MSEVETTAIQATDQLAASQTAKLSARGNELQNTKLSEAAEVRDAFTSFIGETFFSQMIKAMRSSVGESSYFHGGRAEEIFQGQLDQTFSQEMTEASASQFADPLFANQFPQFAEILRNAEQAKQENQPTLSGLEQLRRR